MSSAKRTISLREDQETWLKEHPEINFSGLVQRWLDKFMCAYDGT